MPPPWWAAATAAAVYLAAIAKGKKGWFKVLPALLLATALAPTSAFGSLAFVACAAGDAFLLHKERYFLHGVGAFLVAHLLFVPALLRDGGSQPPALLVAAIVALTAGVLYAVLPHLRGKLRVAVPVYGLTLAAMAVAAGAHSPVTAAGAMIFVLSDGLLAINRFARPLPKAELLVLSTYFAALLALAAGLLQPV